MKVRGGTVKTGELPVGNAVDANGELITVEAKRVMRGPPTRAGRDRHSYPSDKGTSPFDTLNDVVVHKNGTMYVSDPGYFADPRRTQNRLYRIAPDGAVDVAEAFENVPRPNGRRALARPEDALRRLRAAAGRHQAVHREVHRQG